MSPEIMELIKQGGAIAVLGVVLYYGLRFGAKQFERVVDGQIEALKEITASQKGLAQQFAEHAITEERHQAEVLSAMERHHGETRAKVEQLSCYGEGKGNAA